MIAGQLADIIHQFAAGESGVFVFAGIHPDRVAGTNFHAKPAENTAQFVDEKFERPFFDRFDGALFGKNLDTVGRTNRLAEQAGSATDVAILTKHQPMLRAISRRQDFFLVGIFDRHPVLDVKEVVQQMPDFLNAANFIVLENFSKGIIIFRF